jgi:hypothetical protein
VIGSIAENSTKMATSPLLLGLLLGCPVSRIYPRRLLRPVAHFRKEGLTVRVTGGSRVTQNRTFWGSHRMYARVSLIIGGDDDRPGGPLLLKVG